MKPLYADVALPLPGQEPYSYSVPDPWASRIRIGQMVRVPLGSQSSRIGYVVGLSPSAHGLNPARIKPIESIVSDEVFVTPVFFQLGRWMSEYYACSWGQAIETILPAPFRKGQIRMGHKSAPEEEPPVHTTPRHSLTSDQNRAIQEALPALKERRFAQFLLHGVTGSGKTEVYLSLIEEALRRGRGAIVLVPEISLTPQTTERFRDRFGDQVAVLHSRLAPGRRLAEWHRIREGSARVVVGARSAVFGPVQDLGILIMDEEHDDSYKQDETPRYDAGSVAERRCELEKAILIRAGATPSLESVHAARRNWIHLLSLPKRVNNRPLPEVRVVDMRNERAGKNTRIFSVALETAVQKAISNKEQAIILMNRRGFSPFVTCASCGFVAACERCRVSLVFHRERARLLCHSCQKIESPPTSCPKCSGHMRYWGIGTEKVEVEAHRLFPTARIGRMDSDATRKQGSHAKILRQFRKKEIDILLGTQMIAKGHDFPDVTVIGVISADTALHLPDFRAGERAFALLTQAAGRAGRDKAPGTVFIQTTAPDHYAIKAAATQDYDKFYETEIALRKELGNPPLRHLVRAVIYGKVENVVYRRALEFRKATENGVRILKGELLGPAPCSVSKRNDRYYWAIHYKVDEVMPLNDLLLKHAKKLDGRGAEIAVDVDPR